MAKEGLEHLIHTGHIECKRVRSKPSAEEGHGDIERGQRVIGDRMEGKLRISMNSNVLNGRHIEKTTEDITKRTTDNLHAINKWILLKASISIYINMKCV